MGAITTVESIVELTEIQTPVNGQTVYVKSYIVSKSVGGGLFTYYSADATKNDYGLIVNGWNRAFKENYTVEDFWWCL
ncbi:hypothetical protein NDN11_10675 [Acinetobacter sp. C26M]|uniref:hypothetical protein n=1 Tax=unclassified Acinetobacter TaxID=196816 RepID=UPI00203739B8|nr:MULTISPECIES: hypothetical protein [unclassified Acinetobacter]USA45194.1 hypothetical protein NDN11_10675 [Acinetobacter sp. C26M]USA48696.1 hypothetical protein NDN12_10675 [Acinetobacter sp. C26G]